MYSTFFYIFIEIYLSTHNINTAIGDLPCTMDFLHQLVKIHAE